MPQQRRIGNLKKLPILLCQEAVDSIIVTPNSDSRGICIISISENLFYPVGRNPRDSCNRVKGKPLPDHRLYCYDFLPQSALR